MSGKGKRAVKTVRLDGPTILAPQYPQYSDSIEMAKQQGRGVSADMRHQQCGRVGVPPARDKRVSPSEFTYPRP